MSLLELAISVVIFAVITVGTLGVLGASAAGGFWESFPNAFATTRLAREYTAAGAYLQATQEALAARAAAVIPGRYCLGTGCGAGALPPAIPLPAPPASPAQLADWRLEVVIERWHWDESIPGRYCLPETAGCPATPQGEALVRALATLTWTVKGRAVRLAVERFLP